MHPSGDASSRRANDPLAAGPAAESLLDRVRAAAAGAYEILGPLSLGPGPVTFVAREVGTGDGVVLLSLAASASGEGEFELSKSARVALAPTGPGESRHDQVARLADVERLAGDRYHVVAELAPRDGARRYLAHDGASDRVVILHAEPQRLADGALRHAVAATPLTESSQLDATADIQESPPASAASTRSPLVKTCTRCGATYPADQGFCPVDGSRLDTVVGDDSLVGQLVANRYRVVRLLGEGGMGRVYLAEDTSMERRCALKVMHASLVSSPDANARFKREMQNAIRVKHPNVVTVWDYGDTGTGTKYLAMEFVDGEPLSQILKRDGQIPPRRTLGIVQQVGAALAAAHDQKVVHRDLKPDNIMVAPDARGDDRVTVVDFGIAKAMDPTAQKVTGTGFVIGTPDYMSPEQLGAATLDGRSDIYSLALVTFDMLTGRLPFAGQTPQEAMVKRLTDRPRTLKEVCGEVEWPAALQAALDRALARAPSERFATATEFATALTAAIESWVPAPEVVGGAPRPARPPGPLGSTRRARSSRGAAVAAVAGAAVVVALVALLVARPRLRPSNDAKGEQSAVPQGVTPQAPGDGAPSGGPNASLPPPVRETSTGVVAGGQPPKSSSEVNRPVVPNGGREPQTANVRGGDSPTRSGAPTAESFDARAELDRLRVATAPSNDDETVRVAIRTIPSLLARLKTRSDSVEAQLRWAEGEMSLDNAGEACRILERIRVPARGTNFEEHIGNLLGASVLQCRGSS